VKYGRCFRGNLGALFTLREGVREFLVMEVVLASVFVLSLPGKSYFFYLARGRAPYSFGIVTVTAVILVAFFSVRQGIRVFDLNSAQGIPIWIYQEKLDAGAVWIGTTMPALLHVVFQTIVILPFIIMAGTLSGIPVKVLLRLSVFITTGNFFFRMLSMFLSTVSGGRKFLSSLVTAGMLVAAATVTLGAVRDSIRAPWFVWLIIYSVPGICMFLAIRPAIRRKALS